MPDIGYLEVHLANTLTRLGHSVVVITSKYYSTSIKKVKNLKHPDLNTLHQSDDYQIIRLKSLIHFRSIVIPLGLIKTIYKNSPELIIIIGVTKMFALPLILSDKSKIAPIITFFGDNTDMRRNGYFSILKQLQRRILYRRAISISKKIILYTPSTERIICRIIGESFYNRTKNKRIETTLGYDGREFYFDENLREEIRRKLAIKKDEIVLILSTRIVRNKGIEKIINLVDECIDEGKKLKLIITGLFNDSYGSHIRNFVKSLRNSDHFLLFEFLNHKEINGYFNCSDAGVWTQAAISIQQGMGTGLFVLIPDRDSVNHLISDNKNGFVYKDFFKLKDFIMNFNVLNYNRQEILRINQKFEYVNLLSNILNEVTC